MLTLGGQQMSDKCALFPTYNSWAILLVQFPVQEQRIYRIHAKASALHVLLMYKANPEAALDHLGTPKERTSTAHQTLQAT